MLILTAANNVEDKNLLEINKNFSFRSVIQQTMKNACDFGYKTLVYDLGNLNIGEPFDIEDDTFKTKGYYTEINGGYKSKSLFKPDIVKRCLEKHNEFTVYMDGDALLYDKIDEIETHDYDVGVTLRRASEIESEWHKENIDIVRFVNAGVIFFNPTKETFRFVDMWRELTVEVKNDQKALNKLVCPEKYPELNRVYTINGVRIKFFPGDQYNYYYFDESLASNLKILHFKGTVRNFFPFDWKMRAYCLIFIPLIKQMKYLLKKPPKSI